MHVRALVLRPLVFLSGQKRDLVDLLLAHAASLRTKAHPKPVPTVAPPAPTPAHTPPPPSGESSLDISSMTRYVCCCFWFSFCSFLFRVCVFVRCLVGLVVRLLFRFCTFFVLFFCLWLGWVSRVVSVKFGCLVWFVGCLCR